MPVDRELAAQRFDYEVKEAKMKIRRNRDKTLMFYVSDEEKQRIIEAAQESDMSISDYCRKALVKKSEKVEEDGQEDGSC